MCKQRQARTERTTQTQVHTWAKKRVADLKSERKHKGQRLMNMSNWVLSKLRVLKKRVWNHKRNPGNDFATFSYSSAVNLNQWLSMHTMLDVNFSECSCNSTMVAPHCSVYNIPLDSKNQQEVLLLLDQVLA